MKKILSLVLVLCICVSFAACNAKDPNNLFAMTTVAVTASTDCETVSLEEPQTGNEYYQYGNMQKNVPSGNFMRLGNEVLFGYLSNGRFRLYYYDLMTGEVHLYCKDATCKHNSCVASRMLGNLEVYNGKIYILTFEEMPAEIDGQEKKLLTKARVKSFWHYGGKLYARTADSSLVVFEDDSDEPQVIVEDFPCYWEVIFDHYLYAADGSNIMRVDLAAEEPKLEVLIPNAAGITDGRHFYYVDDKTWFLYRCDMDGSNVQLLLDKPVLLASINFDDEYFYYRRYDGIPLYEGEDCHDIYRFPKDDPSQIEKIVTLEEAVYQVFTVPGTGKIFVGTIAADDEECPIYVMNTDGTSLSRLKSPEY